MDALEFSRRQDVETLGRDGLEVQLEARAEERDALARRFGLTGLAELSATLYLRWSRDGQTLNVAGRLRAAVSQECVVSLESFDSRIEETFEAQFTRESSQWARESEALEFGADWAPEVEIDVEAPDPPEPITGRTVDLGELVAQHLSLVLDPHPRRPGAEFEGLSDPEQDFEESPFAVLKTLRDPSS